MHSSARHNVRTVMRDGVELSCDIYLPQDRLPCPVVLTRNCYTKAMSPWAEHAAYWTGHGYGLIVQDVRGRGDSDGRFYPLADEADDASDTLDWIASQDWSDGRIVMYGGSYGGWTQMLAACSANPHLAGLAPMVTPPDPDRAFPISHGMIMPAAATWLAMLDGHTNQDLNTTDVDGALLQRPLIEFDRRLGRSLQPWRDWIEKATQAGYWAGQSYQQRCLASDVPMLHITGWYDDCLVGAIETFSQLSARGGDHGKQRLVIGPWLHGTIGQRKIGDFDYSASAEVDLKDFLRAWYDDCLGRGSDESDPVRLFVMGRNEWIGAAQWPPEGVEYERWYLNGEGKANSAAGDGRLAQTFPDADVAADSYRADPDKPVPYGSKLDWKQVGGPDDFAEIEQRDDILVYTGPVLTEPLLICGPLRVCLFASSSAVDTDWMAKILDVHPDGRAIRLNDGAVRARFRKGTDQEKLLVPGEIEEYEIDCWSTCIELPPGHRLRLEISSSAFGKYDVNPNGGGPIGREVDAVVAEQRVYHDAARPSHILLPILRTGQ